MVTPSRLAFLSCLQSVIRTLMLKLEALPLSMGDNVHLTPEEVGTLIGGFSVHEIDYHLNLLREAGFLDCPDSSQPAFGIMFRGITWQGHDFLDSVRDDAVWGKLKSGMKAAGGFTVELLVSAGKALVKAELAKHLGINLWGFSVRSASLDQWQQQW